MSISIPVSLGAFIGRMRQDEISWQFARNASGAFVIAVLGYLAGFLVLLPLARMMGAESYGTYIYVAAWLQLVAMLAAMGLPNAAQRFVPEYFGTRRWAECWEFLRWGNRQILLSSLLLGLVGTVALVALRNTLAWEGFWTGLVACAALPVTSGVNFRNRVLMAFKNTLRAKGVGLLGAGPRGRFRPSGT